MYHFQHGSPAFAPQEGQPNSPSSMANNQPRRPLAINDMLNHAAPPPSSRDASYPHLAYQYIPQPSLTHPPPIQTPVPQPRHLYPPGTAYRPPFDSTFRHRIELPPLPPPGTSEQRWDVDYYMSHPRGTVPPDHYPSQTLPELNFQNSQELATPTARPGVSWTRKTCVLCLEKFEGEDPKSHFPHQCKRCTSGDFCAGCLKDWFLDACRNESKMPPKCCSIIPLSAVANLLNNVQIELYKAKYEEWATPDRIYCPIPTCSAFIPPRMYTKIRQRPAAPYNDAGDTTTFPTPSPPHAFSNPKKDMKSHVACPTCGVSVCTKCRSLTHIGECPGNDLDPALDEQLKKWKIKRCPKCRAGVRRMYGCSHIECRCGAHFCWECMLPINQCGGQCDDDASDAEPDYHVEEDDLDGNAGFYEGAGPDFGPEPYGHIIDAWGCQHIWSLVIPANPSTLGRRDMECNRCFRIVQPSAKEAPPKPTLDDDTEMTGMTPPSPITFYGEPAWQCVSRHIVCTRCPKQPPASRNGDPSRLWACDCGIQCLACDRAEAMTQHANGEKLARELKEKMDSLAWECRCGTVICGACKSESA